MHDAGDGRIDGHDQSGIPEDPRDDETARFDIPEDVPIDEDARFGILEDARVDVGARFGIPDDVRAASDVIAASSSCPNRRRARLREPSRFRAEMRRRSRAVHRPEAEMDTICPSPTGEMTAPSRQPIRSRPETPARRTTTRDVLV